MKDLRLFGAQIVGNKINWKELPKSVVTVKSVVPKFIANPDDWILSKREIKRYSTHTVFEKLLYIILPAPHRADAVEIRRKKRQQFV